MAAEQKFEKPPSGSEVSGQAMRDAMVDDRVLEPSAPEQKQGPTMEEVAEVLGGTTSASGSVSSQAEKVELPAPVVDGEEVTVDDQKTYLRTLLASEPFTKTYKLYGGAMTITFKSRTTSENDWVDKQLVSGEYKELIAAKSFAIVRERIRITTSIEQCTTGDTDTMVDMDGLDEMSEVTFSALRKCFRNFEGICDVMFERANDSNFWKGIVGTT